MEALLVILIFFNSEKDNQEWPIHPNLSPPSTPPLITSSTSETTQSFSPSSHSHSDSSPNGTSLDLFTVVPLVETFKIGALNQNPTHFPQEFRDSHINSIPTASLHHEPSSEYFYSLISSSLESLSDSSIVEEEEEEEEEKQVAIFNSKVLNSIESREEKEEEEKQVATFNSKVLSSIDSREEEEEEREEEKVNKSVGIKAMRMKRYTSNLHPKVPKSTLPREEDVKKRAVIKEDVKKRAVIKEDVKTRAVIKEDVKKRAVMKEDVKKRVVIKEIWMKQYSNLHKILLVGEGDFSFSASLAVAFSSANNMIATSLDSEEYLRKYYGRAMSNIEKLKSRVCKVVHGVDATKMANHLSLKALRFDRIIFNFPHAGFFKNETRETQLWRHRRLVKLFLKNAKKMMTAKGEIHIRHKSNGFFKEWNLEHLASNHSLRLIEEVHFNFTDFPGYRTKYGFQGDNNFNCNPSKTYIFGLP